MSPSSIHSLVVEAHTQEAEDAVRLRLIVPPEAREAFRWLPGQFLTVRMSVDGRPLRRTYSLVGAPDGAVLEIAVRVQPQGRVSRAIAELIRPGMTLEVLPPAGRFRLPAPGAGAAEPAHYLALAAGSGVTPIFALVRELLESSAHAQCTVAIGNQTLARTMLRGDWLALKDRYLERLALYFVMSREPQEVPWLNGRVDRPWLDRAAGRLFDPAGLTAALLCGPGGFITELSSGLQAHGVAADRIFFERFSADRGERTAPRALGASGAASVQAPVAQAVDEAAMAAAEQPMTEVTIALDGRRRTFIMPRDGTRVLEAAEKAGIALPYSCRDGICATCRAKVLEGEVELGEQYALQPWELAAGFTLACQARPRSARLTLSYDER